MEKNCEANYLRSNIKQFKHFAPNISNIQFKVLRLKIFSINSPVEAAAPIFGNKTVCAIKI